MTIRKNDQTPLRFKIGYKASIWIFSCLLLIMFAVFSIGTFVNIHRLVYLWQESSDINFMTFSESVEMLIALSMSEIFSRPDVISPELNELLIDMFKVYRLNMWDRIFLVSKKQIFQIFPSNSTPVDRDMWEEKDVWERGWQGERVLNIAYRSFDGKNVKANIFPMPIKVEDPDFLVIIERDMGVWNRIQTLIYWMDGFLIAGLIGSIVIIILYAKKMIRPIHRLETTIHTMDAQVPEVSPDEHSDPVNRAIGIFEDTLLKLKEKEMQLEDLTSQLASPSLRVEEFEDNLLASVDSGIFTFDLLHRLMSYTSKSPNLMRLKDSDLIGKTCEELFGTEHVVSRMLMDGLKHRRIYSQKQWKEESPGEFPAWLSIASTLLKGNHGEVTGVGFIVRDITGWKMLQEQIKEKEHLAALGEMSAGIAHEIRNPLGVIQGNANFLAMEITEPALIETVRDIQDEVMKLDRIVNDFLRFAKPTQLNITEVDFHALLDDIILDFTAHAGESVSVTVKTSRRIPSMQIDESLFRQVMANLLNNAAEAMSGKGQIEIRLEMDHLTLSGGRIEDSLVIHVQDFGPGIRAEVFPKLFKPFFTTKSKGNGLGLAIVKKIIVLHNGFVEFEPVETGASVKIMLPVQYDPDQTVDLKKR